MANTNHGAPTHAYVWVSSNVWAPMVQPPATALAGTDNVAAPMHGYVLDGDAWVPLTQF